MIDGLFIFNKYGLILWSYYSTEAPQPKDYSLKDVINGFVENIFLEERLSKKHYDHDIYRVEWVTINEHEIVVAAVYQQAFGLLSSGHYSNSLLLLTKKKIVLLISSFPEAIDDPKFFKDFDDQFLEIISFCDEKYMTRGSSNTGNENHKSRDSFEEPNTSGGDSSTFSNGKLKKGARRWNSQKVTKKAMEELDFSKKYCDSDANNIERNLYTYEQEDKELEDEISETDDNGCENNSKISSYWSGLLSKHFGILDSNCVITEEIIQEPLQKLKSKLIEKNVASEIAHDIIDSISKATVGTKPKDNYSRLDTILHNNLRDAITRILSPKKSIDIFSEVQNAKKHGQIYSIVFLGVNGVGKSTNLAKVCYYLKNKKNLNVMIVACDTFRAGAIEQLKTHANCLGVHLYEKGYGKDAAFVAKDAISYARENNYDVVLIDTAGRMQDNTPLMKSLAKLVQINNPNLVLFVGEALVGNDAVHQLNVFNKFLIEFAERPVDGILLTKFDTVDEKVGAALSMIYTTGQPVIFVGTGQKYFNLKTLSVPSVVNALLK
ncbi:GTpase signal recognition particle receptor alpha subunit [Cryptosporidium ryanae]|uniref:GTpase signal recognition particle receptor alpha subunit n=1 Tax=Cryptosporidium ryanae TaxID=515981 RepID=UPI00351A1A55|nr:GTpase signal recognition particle receptor alpha subunit [Cryptosporidium ryanae]